MASESNVNGLGGEIQSMRFSVVLFDLDGTLINTNDLIVATFQHVLQEKLGLAVSREELYPYFGEPLLQTLARFSAERAVELTDAYRAWNVANHDQLIQQFGGVSDAVKALAAAGLKLGVVTSKRTEMARRGLRVSGMEEFFHTVVGLDLTTKHKPDAEPALLALQHLGEEPGPHVLMVGDSRFDMLCGRNAGVKTAAVGWSLQTRAELDQTHPDLWIERPADLVPTILGA